MSESASTAIRELAVVLRTAEAQISSVFGLTLGFSDGLSIRLKGLERAEELLHRSGYSSGAMTPARAERAELAELLAHVGLGSGGAAPVQTAPVQAAPVQAAPVDVQPVDLDPADFEEVEPEPVEIEPVSIEPVDLDPADFVEIEPEPVEIEPEPVEIEPEPVEIEPEPVEIEPEPVEIEPVAIEPLPIDDLLGDPELTDDETQLFVRNAGGAIPVDFDDDEDESTLVVSAEDAQKLMRRIDPDPEPDHFDLVAPAEFGSDDLEELEPDELEEIEPVELDNSDHDELPPDEDTDEAPMERFQKERAAAAAPQIRSATDRPGAAAVQLGATGARVIAPEEEEEIAVESAPDEDDYDYDSEGGFALSLEEDEYEEYEEEEEEEAPAPAPAPPPPPPPGPSAEDIQGFIDRAVHELAEGGLEEAALSYSDALDGDPLNGEVRVARGRIYMDMGDYSRAVSDFLIAETVLTESAEPHVFLGELYSHKKDYAKANNYLDIALRLNPRHPMAYYRRGLCFMKTKQFKKAVDDLGRARALDEELPSIDHFLAQAMKKAKL